MIRPGWEFSVTPLVEKLGDVEDQTAAEMLGVHLGTFRKWKYSKRFHLCAWKADEYACRIGLHPSSIWGRQWWSS